MTVLSPGQRMAAFAMSEDELQENVRELCKLLGLDVQHINDSRRCWLPGWPDLWIAGDGGILHRELKDMRNSVSLDQRRVGSRIIRSGGDWAIWRPIDWVDGTIRHALEALARPRVEA